ncbi:MAG TPA: DUF3298 domain-containing protein [Planctomycetes bacterium]|nr:DUF3298 domain-containing protein [Planctomycetota bacterium]
MKKILPILALFLASCGSDPAWRDAHYREDGELGSYMAATYPQVVCAGVAQKMALNAAIEHKVLGKLGDCRDFVIEESCRSMEGMKTDPSKYGHSYREWRYESTYQLGHIEPDSVSFCVKEYSYTGGAHGNWNFYPVNFLWSGGGVKETPLEALFDQSKQWRECLDELIWAGFLDLLSERSDNEEYLRKVRKDAEAKKDMHKETPFAYSAEGVTFFFDPYRLSSFSMGDFCILVPLNKIDKLLDQNGPMKRYLVSRAQFNLGLMYGSGEGVLKDDKEAVKWYRKAANQGLADAQFMLGSIHHDGVGVLKDYVAAYAWYSLSAFIGDEDGKENRDKLAEKMTPEQIAEAQELSKELLKQIEENKKKAK